MALKTYGKFKIVELSEFKQAHKERSKRYGREKKSRRKFIKGLKERGFMFDKLKHAA